MDLREPSELPGPEPTTTMVVAGSDTGIHSQLPSASAASQGPNGSSSAQVGDAASASAGEERERQQGHAGDAGEKDQEQKAIGSASGGGNDGDAETEGRKATLAFLKNQQEGEGGGGSGGGAAEADAELLASLPEVSREELARCDGVESPRILIAVAGMVFEMTSAPDFYGPGAGYALFAGHDATVNLARSSLKAATIDASAAEVGLRAEDLECLKSWVARYRKKYPLVGRFAANTEALHLEPSSETLTEEAGEEAEGDCVIS